jgi:hypothetical protein
LIWSLSKARRRIGIAGLGVLLVGHSIVLWYGTRNQLIDRAGNAIKCYVLSRDGSVTYGEHPGIDPATGRECRPVKPEIVERLQKYAAGKRAEQIDDPNPTFFDPRSGEPIVWYYKLKTGQIELYDLMGFEPNTGDELLPITKEIAQEWKTQYRRGPKLIKDPENYVFCDSVNGNPRAWYWRDSDGAYLFYDASGFQPQTGDQLKIVSRDVVDDWKKHPRPHIARSSLIPADTRSLILIREQHRSGIGELRMGNIDSITHPDLSLKREKSCPSSRGMQCPSGKRP